MKTETTNRLDIHMKHCNITTYGLADSTSAQDIAGISEE